jgi:hypothetical protein
LEDVYDEERKKRGIQDLREQHRRKRERLAQQSRANSASPKPISPSTLAFQPLSRPHTVQQTVDSRQQTVDDRQQTLQTQSQPQTPQSRLHTRQSRQSRPHTAQPRTIEKRGTDMGVLTNFSKERDIPGASLEHSRDISGAALEHLGDATRLGGPVYARALDDMIRTLDLRANGSTRGHQEGPSVQGSYGSTRKHQEGGPAKRKGVIRARKGPFIPPESSRFNNRHFL